MRNDTASWPAPLSSDFTWHADGLTLRRLPLCRQTLVSGVDALSAFEPAIGWPEAAQGDSYTVALRRDRVLRVGAPEMRDGWDSALGHAVTDMSGGFAMFDLTGERVPDLLLRGADMLASRSALRLWAGLNVIIYHHGESGTVRCHILRARAESFVETIQRRAATMIGEP